MFYVFINNGDHVNYKENLDDFNDSLLPYPKNFTYIHIYPLKAEEKNVLYETFKTQVDRMFL